MLTLEERKRVRGGERVFNSVGCAACHVADLQPAQGIFSDLLLHDMGPELQDPFPAPTFQLGNINPPAAASPDRGRYGRGDTSPYRTESPRGGAESPRSGSGSPRDGYEAPRHHRRSGSRAASPLVPAGTPQAIALDYPEKPRFPRGDVDQDDLHRRHPFSWDALQREWKTPPLWGVADSAPYLHDGRAETLTDAIHWHGGEADESKQNFFKLKDDQQQLLLAFLESLKAPLD